MKKNLPTACLSYLCLAVAAGAEFSKQRLEWNRPIKPFHIIGNIYFVGTAGLGSYLIATPSGNIILDGALPESAAQIEQHVAALGFRPKDTKFLLNTHAHYDHAGGLAQLKRASGAKMVASREDAKVLESGFQSSYGAGWDSRFPAIKVDRIVKDGDTVGLDGTSMAAHITPGHTKGCTTWTMTVREAGKPYHVVFYCSTSVPGYRLVNNRYYPQIASDYEHSFAVLEKLPCDVFLANHTEFFHLQDKLARVKPGAPNPFVNPAECRAFVADSKRQFEQTLREQERTNH